MQKTTRARGTNLEVHCIPNRTSLRECMCRRSVETCWVLPLKYDANQDSAVSRPPNTDLNLLSKIPWLMVSKAALKSNRTNEATCCLFMLVQCHFWLSRKRIPCCETYDMATVAYCSVFMQPRPQGAFSWLWRSGASPPKPGKSGLGTSLLFMLMWCCSCLANALSVSLEMNCKLLTGR